MAVTFDDREEKFSLLREKAIAFLEQNKGGMRSESENILELIQELEIHQAELQIQNEELQNAQQEISVLYSDLDHLYEYAPCGYVTLSPEGMITRINNTGLSLFGIGCDKLLYQPFSNLISDEHALLYQKARKMAFDKREIQYISVQINVPAKSKDWYSVTIRADIEEGGALKQYCVMISDISALKHIESELKKSVVFNKNLLIELKHRIKNSFALVISLISLQSTNSGDEKVADALNQLNRRIRAVSELYSQLYISHVACDSVNLNIYLQRIIDGLKAYSVKRQIRSSIVSVEVKHKIALSIGLIINELVNNALKYGGSSEKDGHISISLDKKGTMLCLAVEDEGRGFPANFAEKKSGGMGLGLVRMLADQHDGNFSIEKNTAGNSRIVVNLMLDEEN